MGRSLLVLGILVGAVALARPRAATAAPGLRGWPWLAAGLGLQLLWVRGLAGHLPAASALSWLPSLALLPALRFVWLNRHYRGLWLVAAGALLNGLVMAANGGLMPIAPHSRHALGAHGGHGGASLVLSKDRLLADGAAHLALLDDRLVGSVAGIHVAGSVGDLLVVAGCLAVVGEEVWRLTRTRPAVRRPRRHEQPA